MRSPAGDWMKIRDRICDWPNATNRVPRSEPERCFPGLHRADRFIAVAGETQAGDFDFGLARQLHEDAGQKHEIEPALGRGGDVRPGQEPFVRREASSFFPAKVPAAGALDCQDRARDFALEKRPAGGEEEEHESAKHACTTMQEASAACVFEAIHVLTKSSPGRGAPFCKRGG